MVVYSCCCLLYSVAECFSHAVIPAASAKTLPLQKHPGQRGAVSCGDCPQCKMEFEPLDLDFSAHTHTVLSF